MQGSWGFRIVFEVRNIGRMALHRRAPFDWPVGLRSGITEPKIRGHVHEYDLGEKRMQSHCSPEPV